jgi:hypothetical protein
MEYQFKINYKTESKDKKDPKDNLEVLIKWLQEFCVTKYDKTDIIGRKLELEYKTEYDKMKIEIKSDYAKGFVGKYINCVLINTDNDLPNEFLRELKKVGYRTEEEKKNI